MAHNLFFREVYRGKEIDCLLVTKVNVVAEQKDEDEFRDVLFLLVAVHPVSC